MPACAAPGGESADAAVGIELAATVRAELQINDI
jgi:hypothetical protein